MKGVRATKSSAQGRPISVISASEKRRLSARKAGNDTTRSPRKRAR